MPPPTDQCTDPNGCWPPPQKPVSPAEPPVFPPINPPPTDQCTDPNGCWPPPQKPVSPAEPPVFPPIQPPPPSITSFGRDIINVATTTAELITEIVRQLRSNSQIQKIMSEPAVQISISVVNIITAGTAVVVGAMGVMPLATSLLDFLSLPLRLFSLISGALGKKRRKWGTVYDSVTKQPLDPVYVILKDKNGKTIEERITDMNGRFGFLVQAGEYYIETNKTNYKFPSEKVIGSADELYDHLYHGELLKIDDPDALIVNVPMDAEGFDWNEMIKQQDKYIKFNYHWEVFKRWLPTISFVLGFSVAAAAWILSPTLFNKIMLWCFIVLLILRQIGFKERIWGLILDKASKKPLSFAMLKVFFEKMGQQVHSATSDLRGRYYALVEPGRYDMEINEKKIPEGYAPLKKEQGINARHGILNKDIFIDKTP